MPVWRESMSTVSEYYLAGGVKGRLCRFEPHRVGEMLEQASLDGEKGRVPTHAALCFLGRA
jgi:hypothetical protein